MITHDELLSRYHYDPDTGIFTNRRTGKRAGGVTFSTSRRDKPYRFVNLKIDKKNYKAHRLAWFYIHGAWPTHVIDHIDQDSLNNRLSNLRDVTLSENTKNTPRCDNVIDTREPFWHSPGS